MRINRVLVENYGLFSGRNEFDFVPRSRRRTLRPIILVGGKNGSGKTTLLSAIRLALYGRASYPGRIADREYQESLRALIHRSHNAIIQVNYGRVAIEFDYVQRGVRETYYVQRAWESRNSRGIVELLEVRKKPPESGALASSRWPVLGEVEPSHWQAFINEIVPERLSQLFFFDGEMIKSIAEDISGDSSVADAIKSLLGLDIAQRLKADLAILEARETKRSGIATARDMPIESIEDEIRSLNQRRADLQEKIAATETELSGIEAEVLRLERQLQDQGGGFYSDRPIKQSRKIELDSEIAEIQSTIRGECEKDFPIALCPSVQKLLSCQIEFEAEASRKEVLRDELSSLKNEMISRFSTAKTFPMGPVRKDALDIVNETIDKHLSTDNHRGGDSFLLLSPVDALEINKTLNGAAAIAQERVLSSCRRLEEKERELQEITRQLQMAPDQAALSPVFEELGQQNRLHGRKTAELKSLKVQLSGLNTAYEAKEREHQRALEEGRASMRSSEQKKLMRSAQVALDLFHSRLISSKTESLCKSITDCFNRLSRKGDMLSHIRIDPNSFALSLFDRNEARLSHEELSAGEKQILAISILWGLARTSGRPLPVIIDTPLGRLDSSHRLNLISNYFPYAAHQVILFSTDTEVDQPLYKELQPHISHCYHLVYDKDERRTLAREEYFWK
jgi:DNA sulfur modification protein DndD